MTSLNQFCKDHNLPKTSVYRWMTEQGHPTNNGVSEELQAAILEQFSKPEPAPAPEPEVIEPEVFETAMVLHSPAAAGIVPIQIENLTINLTQANTAALDQESAHFHQVTSQGLAAIGQYLQADLVTTVHHTVAQNRHAIAGLAAQAAVSLANNLGKPAQEGEQ
ncbi:MAG: hypothetical protein VKL98_05750 [Cyanobacteriota bacterium]|nr:hypothetical protein [Cyanobacteriota bacterium]